MVVDLLIIAGFIGLALWGWRAWNTSRAPRQPPTPPTNGGQPAQPAQATTGGAPDIMSGALKLGKGIYWMFFLGILSCVVTVVAVFISWMLSVASEMNDRYEKAGAEFEQSLQPPAQPAAAGTWDAEAWKAKAKFLLAHSYAYDKGWRNANSALVQVGNSSKQCQFPIIPYCGVHLPPLELALAPTGTKWNMADGYTGSLVDIKTRDLLAHYVRKTPYGTEITSFVPVASDSRETPYLSLSSTLPDRTDGLESEVTCQVWYPSKEVMEWDSATRLCLEKVWQSDFNQSVKVMDLPTEIDGFRVYWDLVIRSYPGWLADPSTRTGRWMKSPTLSDDHLSESAPRLLLMTVDDPVVVDPVRPWQAEVVYYDTGGLLVNGYFQTSSEDMARKVQSWRQREGLPDIGWEGGDQLHIYVPKRVDVGRTGLPFGVTIRVVLRLRTQPKG